jgi:hypothetical protein
VHLPQNISVRREKNEEKLLFFYFTTRLVLSHFLRASGTAA